MRYLSELVSKNREIKKGLKQKIKNGEIVSTTRGVTYSLNEGQSKNDELTEEQKKSVYDRYYEALKD